MAKLVTFEDLANGLLDLYVDFFGTIRAIQWLIDFGCDKDQICNELGFDESDYEKALEDEEEER